MKKETIQMIGEKGSIPVQDLFDSDFSFLKLLKTHNFHFLYLFLYVVVFVPIDERLFSVYGCFFTYRLKVVFYMQLFFYLVVFLPTHHYIHQDLLISLRPISTGQFYIILQFTPPICCLVAK